MVVPGFSVGEVEKRGSPGRREVGHGALARRAIAQVLPAPENFPYCIRLCSDILESNGSSSMATVCSGSLALMAGDGRGRAHGPEAAEPTVRLARVVSLSQRLGDDLALPPVQRVGLAVWPGEPRPLLVRADGARASTDAVLLAADPVSREPESLILPVHPEVQRGVRLWLGETGHEGRIELVASVLGSPTFRQWLFRRLPD